jgi:hypothetical protein
VTIVLDPTGIARDIWAVDDVVTHPCEVLDAVKRLQPGAV